MCSRCGEPLPPGAKFCPSCGAPVAIAPASERRLVTVVFVDLVGSTKLANQLDPERFREVLAAFHGMVTEEVEWLRGRAESFIGDAVLAVFGVPTSHDDDAVRAIRAALSVVNRAPQLGRELGLPTPMQVHAGINTGLVAVGTAADRGIVIGGEVNIGARLQQAAAPDEVLGGFHDPPIGEGGGRVRRDAHDRPQGVRRRDPRLAGDPPGAAFDPLDDPVRRSPPRARAAVRYVRAGAGAQPRAPGDAARRARDRQDPRGGGVPRRPGRRRHGAERPAEPVRGAGHVLAVGTDDPDRDRGRRGHALRGTARPSAGGGGRVGRSEGRGQGGASPQPRAGLGRGREPREPVPQRRDPTRHARHDRGPDRDAAGRVGVRGSACGRAAAAGSDRTPDARYASVAAAGDLRRALGLPGRAAGLGGRARRRRDALGRAARGRRRRATRDRGGGPGSGRRAPCRRARRREPAVHRRDHRHAAPRGGRAAADGRRRAGHRPAAAHGPGRDRLEDRFALAGGTRPDPQGLGVRARRVRCRRALARRRAAQGRDDRAGGRGVPGSRAGSQGRVAVPERGAARRRVREPGQARASAPAPARRQPVVRSRQRRAVPPHDRVPPGAGGERGPGSEPARPLDRGPGGRGAREGGRSRAPSHRGEVRRRPVRARAGVGGTGGTLGRPRGDDPVEVGRVALLAG